jgi:hypothetical protein
MSRGGISVDPRDTVIRQKEYVNVQRIDILLATKYPFDKEANNHRRN